MPTSSAGYRLSVDMRMLRLLCTESVQHSHAAGTAARCSYAEGYF